MISARAIPDSVMAVGFLAAAFAVNDLFAATARTALGHRRAALMIAALTGALAQTCLVAAAPFGIEALQRVLAGLAALSFLTLLVLCRAPIRRIRQGQMKIVNPRMQDLAQRAQAQAQAARAWLDMAEQAAHVGHWQLTVPENRLIWSDEMFRIHGLWREHYQPDVETVLAAFHPLDSKRLAALLQGVATDGGSFDMAARLRRPDGEIRNVTLSAQAVLGEDGTVELVNGVMLDVTEPKRAETRPPAHAGAVDGIAGEDAVTGLADRAQFDASLGYEFKRAVRSKKPLGLVLIEIDQFDQFISHYGARQANICLRDVAQAVQAVPRRTGDIVARYSDTEIAVLLPLADGSGALRVAGQIAEAIRALGLADAGRKDGLLTVSCGAASFTMDDLYNPLELTRRAARALAEAKVNGGGRVCAYREPAFEGVLAVRG